MPDIDTCRHCERRIVNEDGRWVDPEATGDDSVWRETCDAHDTFTAEHEPAAFPVAPGRRRVVATFDVTDDGLDTHDLALNLSLQPGVNDVTVWEWEGFWRDVADERVTRRHDLTSDRKHDDHESGVT